MLKALRFGPILLPMLAITALAACSDSSEHTPVIDTQPTTAARAGGDWGPRYDNPIPVTTGDYRAADFDYKDASDKAIAAGFNTGPAFSGEIAGITLLAPDQVDKLPAGCGIATFPEGVHFQFSYLPPGTSLASPQYAGVCADGTEVFATQNFVTKHGSFTVEFDRNRRTYMLAPPKKLVHAEKLNGQDALVVDSVGPEGEGQSLVAISTSNGMIFITGDNVPVSEFIKVLENLKCGDC